MSEVIGVQFESSCPRCGCQMRQRQAMNALSRRDNKTYICSSCGQDEALLDFARSQSSKRAARLSMENELKDWERLPATITIGAKGKDGNPK